MLMMYRESFGDKSSASYDRNVLLSAMFQMFQSILGTIPTEHIQQWNACLVWPSTKLNFPDFKLCFKIVAPRLAGY